MCHNIADTYTYEGYSLASHRSVRGAREGKGGDGIACGRTRHARRKGAGGRWNSMRAYAARAEERGRRKNTYGDCGQAFVPQRNVIIQLHT